MITNEKLAINNWVIKDEGDNQKLILGNMFIKL